MLRYLLVLFGLIFLVWTAATSLTRVESHQRAVIRRFGRILNEKPAQGLHIGLPWGIDRVDLVPVGRDRSLTVGFLDSEETTEDVMPPGQMLTGDHNLVNVQASINYRIRDDEADQYVLQQDQVDAFVARAAESLLAEWIAARNVDFVLRQGKSKLPEFVHQQLPGRLNEYQLGIEIGLVSIKLETPTQVRAAFNRLAEAKTNIDTKVNKAQQEADRLDDLEKSEAFKIAQRADAYARIQTIAARADADSFKSRVNQYRELSAKNPDYLNAIWLDEMTRLYAKMREEGRIELLDHFLTSEGLSITQFPLHKKK